MKLKIGKFEFDNPWIQGPLAGYTHAAFRKNLWQGKLAYACTEMLPASCVINELHDQSNRFTWRHPCEKVLCYQISGRNPRVLAQAATILEDLGADIIDLNAGCPKPKIRKKGCGSALLDDTSTLLECLDSLKQNSNCPVTVKIRVPNPNSTTSTSDLIKMICSTGVDAITLHARNWQGGPIMPEHYIAAINAANCPIIINGDIKTISEGLEQCKQVNAAGFMIAREGFKKPWMYNMAKIDQETFLHYIKEHLFGMQQFMSERTILLQARSIMHYYSKDLSREVSSKILTATFEAQTLDNLMTELTKIITSTSELLPSDLFDQ